ncbi:hypothetical protein EJ08DRAFT_663794 [Tothia fuscella]|uniref:Uncharacterized protein n=1 Tax=Tothia fuscella TaxID=1048955 RepID=A0A9P4NKS7_9PEZI|nr:hypothetical protein EJ08DRAFT_663794 [Tothia fuscella]
MKGLIGFVGLVSVAAVSAKPLLVGKNGPVVQASAGTMGMDPAIFRPLQKRENANSNFVGGLSTFGSALKKRQQEVDAILEALAENNPEDAEAVKKALKKRQDEVSDEAAALLEAETPIITNTEAQKASLDADVLAANGLNSDFSSMGSADASTAQSSTGTTDLSADTGAQVESTGADSQAETGSTDTQPADGNAASDADTAIVDDEGVEKRQIRDAHAALVKFASLDPDAAQFVKAFVTSLAKRQGSECSRDCHSYGYRNGDSIPSLSRAMISANVKQIGGANNAQAAQSGAAEATSAASTSAAGNEATPAAANANSASAGESSASPAAESTSAGSGTSSASAEATPDPNVNAKPNSTESATTTESTPAAATANPNGGRTTFDNSQGVEVPIAAIAGGDSSGEADEKVIRAGVMGTDLAAGGFTYKKRSEKRERKIRRSGTLMFFRS